MEVQQRFAPYARRIKRLRSSENNNNNNPFPTAQNLSTNTIAIRESVLKGDRMLVVANKPMTALDLALPPGRCGGILPTEILDVIFHQVIGSSTYTYNRAILPTLKMEADTIRGASQVCRLWRTITLGRKEIWGIILNVDLNSVLWIEELLRRSGSAPLLIQSLPTKDPNGVDTRDFSSAKWDLVLEQTHRFWKLDITLPEEKVLDMHHVWKRPAPLLESLALRMEVPGSFFAQGTVSKDSLFAGVTPNMKNLILDGVLFLWRPADSPSLNIVRLDLSLAEKYMSFRVYSPLQPLDLNVLAIKRKMHLPNLQELAFTGNRNGNKLLSLVVIPSSCMVTLSVTERYGYSLTDSLLPWLEGYFQGWKSHSPVYSWSLSTLPKGGFAFHAGTTDDPSNRPRFVLEYNSAHSTNLLLARFLEFLLQRHIVEESAVLMLDLHAPLQRSDGVAEALQALLSSCDRLSELQLLGDSLANVVVPVLLKYPKTLGPSLRKLVIEENPNAGCRNSLLYALCLVEEYLDQRSKTQGENLPEITFVTDKSKERFVWNLMSGSNDEVYSAEKVEYCAFKPRVIERGELPLQDLWSLGKTDTWRREN